MIFSLRTFSRSVHEEEQSENKPEIIDDGSCRSLTVWRKSMVIGCNGFTVFDSNGEIVYRVENYIGQTDELALMDGSGQFVLTMNRRKKLGIVEKWLVYEGEEAMARTEESSKEAKWCVKKQRKNILGGNSNVLAYVYRGEWGRRRRAYVVEGSYGQRSCKVLDERRRVVAEMRRKEGVNGNVSFGLDVFVLIVHNGFHPGFAMALVLLLDQMFS